MTLRDRARDRVRDASSAELVERLDHLDAIYDKKKFVDHDPPKIPGPDTRLDFDVVIAGGGLWLLVAPLLAARGLRVAVLDRVRAGSAHREWNASGPELRPLVASGILEQHELDAMVVARYETGFCRFFGGGTHVVEGILDHAVDAGPLLTRVRAVCEERGVKFFDGHEVTSHAVGVGAIRVRSKHAGAIVDLTARWLVDARGAASPYARADLVCPTVGGVLSGLVEGDGLLEFDPKVGEILVTVDPIESGKQHVWEGFPGRPGEMTVYVFHYARSSDPVSLAELYARFFDTLPTYKRGDARLIRPTFGFIPGWSRLSRAPAPPDRRIVLVGDAAARHSPLTYCGFGATLRSFVRVADAIAQAAERNLDRIDLGDREPIHALTGALAHMIAAPNFRGQEHNELLDAAFRTLAEMGNDAYGDLLRDEMTPPQFFEFLRKTAARHPAVWGKVARGLGARAAGKWGFGVARALL